MRALSTLVGLLVCLSPGSQGYHRRNDSETRCMVVNFVDTAICQHEGSKLTCAQGIASEWLKLERPVKELQLINWPGECLNLNRLQYFFPDLVSLQLLNSSALTHFKGHFDDKNNIEKLSLHGLNSLWELPGDAVALMPRLRELDLRGNVLRHMRARMIRGPPNLEKVFLGDNKWDCSDGGLDWLAMEKDNSSVKRLIVDYQHLMCNQKLYRGKPLHKVMNVIRSVRQTCPEPCACAMTHVVSDPASPGAIIPLITVNCSSRDLETPPPMLPPSTSTLRLEGNKISTIRTMLQNPQYQRLLDLHLDNNSISSVKELEGSEWFSSFRVLSLRGNLLKQIPVYAFDKAFQSNNDIMHVFLGHNPWRCDCHYTPRFQALLLKYKRVIRDLEDIRCALEEDKETSLMQISLMPLSVVCKSSTVTMPISTTDIVNLVLVFLILLVVGRFLYDWHNFRTTGRLPWISTVLP